MKTVQSLMSIGLGFALAWGILTFFPQRQVSTFTLDPWPVDVDNSNLALVGVGLSTQMPKPSVMDPASPSTKPKMVILSPASPMKSPVASSPAPMVTASPVPQPPVTASPMTMTGPSPSV